MTLVAAEDLTPRELDVVSQLMNGVITTASLAETLVIGETTVHYHLGRIFQKLGLTSRAELVSHAARHGSMKDGRWQPN